MRELEPLLFSWSANGAPEKAAYLCPFDALKVGDGPFLTACYAGGAEEYAKQRRPATEGQGGFAKAVKALKKGASLEERRPDWYLSVRADRAEMRWRGLMVEAWLRMNAPDLLDHVEVIRLMDLWSNGDDPRDFGVVRDELNRSVGGAGRVIAKAALGRAWVFVKLLKSSEIHSSLETGMIAYPVKPIDEGYILFWFLDCLAEYLFVERWKVPTGASGTIDVLRTWLQGGSTRERIKAHLWWMYESPKADLLTVDYVRSHLTGAVGVRSESMMTRDDVLDFVRALRAYLSGVLAKHEKRDDGTLEGDRAEADALRVRGKRFDPRVVGKDQANAVSYALASLPNPPWGVHKSRAISSLRLLDRLIAYMEGTQAAQASEEA